MFFNMIDYSIDTTNDVDQSRLDRMIKEKSEFFEAVASSIKFWETPLQPNSLLKMVNDVLATNGIEMVFEDIFAYKRSKCQYNANIYMHERGSDMIYTMKVRINGD